MEATREDTLEGIREVKDTKHHKADPGTCDFCREIGTGQLDPAIALRYQQTSRICRESNNAVVVPSVSPLAVGHLLVIPRRHVRSTRALPSHVKQELLEVMVQTHDTLRALFGDIYFFEHGIGVDSNEAGCGIDHAHIHMIPMADSLATRLNLLLIDDLLQHYASSQHWVGRIDHVIGSSDSVSSSYLFFGSLKEIHVFGSVRLPSQFMRKHLARLLGKADWDWRGLDNRDDFETTLSSLNV